MSMDNETKRVVCRMIAGLLTSDDDFADSERIFIDKLLQEFEIPENEWDAIFPLMNQDEAEAAMKALAPGDQKEVFELLLSAAMADGIIADEERAFLMMIGTVVGMSAEQVMTRVSTAEKKSA